MDPKVKLPYNHGYPLFPAATLAELEHERGKLGRDILWLEDRVPITVDLPDLPKMQHTYDLLDRAITRRRELGEG